MSPRAFAPHKTTKGINSYSTLINDLPESINEQTILDLACGDGHLISYILPRLGPNSKIIGIDMSEGELAIARTNISDPRVTFLNSKAQNLSLKDNEVDHCFCHMAFMLMLPIEPVVAETSRVLKSGGTFTAIINNPKKIEGVLAEILQVCHGFIDGLYPKIKEARLNLSKVHAEEDLKRLFTNDLGFGNPTVENFELNVQTTPEGAWEFMKDMYFIGMLPDEEKKQFRIELISALSEKAGPIFFGFPMMKINIAKSK